MIDGAVGRPWISETQPDRKCLQPHGLGPPGFWHFHRMISLISSWKLFNFRQFSVFLRRRCGQRGRAKFHTEKSRIVGTQYGTHHCFGGYSCSTPFPPPRHRLRTFRASNPVYYGPMTVAPGKKRGWPVSNCKMAVQVQLDVRRLIHNASLNVPKTTAIPNTGQAKTIHG